MGRPPDDRDRDASEGRRTPSADGSGGAPDTDGSAPLPVAADAFPSAAAEAFPPVARASLTDGAVSGRPSQASDSPSVDGEPSPVDGALGIGDEGPSADEELPLGDHVEEMVSRGAVVFVVAAVVSALAYPFSDTLVTVIWNYVLPNAHASRPHLYSPLALVITQLKVASLVGIVAALPAAVYETYAFMRPGLYPNERRYYLAAVPTSLVLAVLGVSFAFFLVLPATFAYLHGYSSAVARSALSLTSTFNLILVTMGYTAFVFQLPLFVFLAVSMNLTTREWLRSRRLLVWGVIAGVAFTFTTIDVSGVTSIIVGATMIALFEGTLVLLRWTGS